MSDGARLAARIWLPEDADDDPVPAVMEYIPRTARTTPWRSGTDPSMPTSQETATVAVRVDLRGSGDSDGIMLDEYLPQEQSDGVDAIRWLAAQSWCTGKVGIIGKSWGGSTGLDSLPRPARIGRGDQCRLDR